MKDFAHSRGMHSLKHKQHHEFQMTQTPKADWANRKQTFNQADAEIQDTKLYNRKSTDMKHFKGNPKTHKETDTPTQDNLSHTLGSIRENGPS